MGNGVFKCLGSSTEKPVEHLETASRPEKHAPSTQSHIKSSISEKHETDKKEMNEKKIVPSTEPRTTVSIPEKDETDKKMINEKKTVPWTQPRITSSISENHETDKETINEKKTVHSPDPSIPVEIIIEILSWLPVNILLRFKCVSKQWHAIIEDHHFMKKNMSRATIASIQYNRVVENACAPAFQFLSGCDGLLLNMSHGSRKYWIKNPTTRQILDLPDPHNGNLDISLFCIPSTCDYKLVSIYDIDGRKAGNEGYEVLTIGTDDSWRPLEVPSLLDVNKKTGKASVIVSAGSTVHCIRWSNASNRCQEVVSLDVETECFTVTALPNWQNFHGVGWNGKLSLVKIVQASIHVLVFEDHKRKKWGAEFVISLAFLTENQDMRVDLVPLFAENGDLWFMSKQEKVFAYNMDSGTIGHTVLAPSGRKMGNKYYRCPSSLVTLKGMRPEQPQPQS